jgi:N6-adenosine-specific RNA methylase IME4
MSINEIAALPVRELTDDRGARLFLWATNRYLPDAFGVVTAWGFTYKQTLIWRKTGNPTPFGGSLAPNAEFLLVATRRSVPRLGRFREAVIDGPAAAAIGSHSTKPELFLDEIERVSPGPYLEMFARRTRFQWDTWGNEALNHIEIA